MASTATTFSLPQRHHRLSRSPRKSGIATASTPNLNSVYSAHSRLVPSSSALARKASFATLTPSSLASIPDDSESYAISSVLSDSSRKMPPVTPGKGAGAGDDVALGDTVDVPGNMSGIIRFVGSVAGRKGTFAGVELHPDYAARGKNSGDVDGVFYFTTSAPGSGIFVPINKLNKPRDAPPTPSSSYSITPHGLKVANQNATNYTPPTPSLPTFSKSLGPSRAPSPATKRSRTSLPRPDSPVRRLQLTPAPRQSMATPGPKAGVPPPRYGTPSVSRFASSVRGTSGDPNKTSRLDRKPSIVPRSASALGQTSNFDEDEARPLATRTTKTNGNGSVGSGSSFSFKRPASRATHANEEEVERLKSQLEDRDRQLKDQASALAEMESSLSELTMLIDQSDSGRMRAGSLDDKDSPQLRAMLREKNEKIAMLTSEFDAHRADFRSTIDTLEMASTETQRVYDAKIRELEQDLRDAQERHEDVDSVARQLKQLEELVQELEEGLEDSRRGEAEARGEVEFLRGEVERTRSELRREREKAAAALNGDGPGEDKLSMSKELEQKEDEIRGLKAIIHSLSRDSVPGSESSPDKTPTRNGSFIKSRPDSIDSRLAKEKLEREVFELRSLVDNKNLREEELEREIESLRRNSASTNRVSSTTISSAHRSSYRDSKGTVILAREPHSSENTHKRKQTLDTMPESDAYSSITETSTLWCEICETSGHDILTCTNMFGPQNEPAKATNGEHKTGKDVVRESLRHLSVPTDVSDEDTPRPLSPMKPKATFVPPTVKILPNPQDSGPLAGKDSGMVDIEKWCALCERDGHDSIDCPLEDAF
ncbi:hypothetical protein F4781DRAFT_299774 [Annulohypoxylon bovei var. microspora]|nr:hypothetical protein F4781DRAFT_299774 [Annulohypoxylon bovei var. microspora]